MFKSNTFGKNSNSQIFCYSKIYAKGRSYLCFQGSYSSCKQRIVRFHLECKDKVKRSALVNDIEHGDLKMLYIECMVKAQRIMCLKKYTEDYVSPWKILLEYYLGNVGGKFILKCQFDTCKLPISLPVFYKDCFDAWSFLDKTDVVTYGDIMNQVIWR